MSAIVMNGGVDVAFAAHNGFGDSYRNYENSERQDTVSENYFKQHSQMTVDFVKGMQEKWLKLDKGSYTIMEAIEMLDQLVDDSDPDNDLPNSVHDFQTAERIREAWPEHEWFHLVGLLHDLGKVMALWGEPQWCVVGDTFPVGCRFSEKCVFPQHFETNPDNKDAVYSTENGVYEVGCGISNLQMAWGHDEYMYWMLKKNGCTIPEVGLNMIRFHSFYPWHDAGAYKQFEGPGDRETLAMVKEFNRFDLYSKGDKVPDVEGLKPYYQGLCEKFGIGGKLKW
jgi:inositol oxygenase